MQSSTRLGTVLTSKSSSAPFHEFGDIHGIEPAGSRPGKIAALSRRDRHAGAQSREHIGKHFSCSAVARDGAPRAVQGYLHIFHGYFYNALRRRHGVVDGKFLALKIIKHADTFLKKLDLSAPSIIPANTV